MLISNREASYFYFFRLLIKIQGRTMETTTYAADTAEVSYLSIMTFNLIYETSAQPSLITK